MAEQETICIVPLRKEILKVPRYMRTRKAVRAMREYLIRHFKNPDVLIGQELNNHLHERGKHNPPVHVKVKVYKFKDQLIADTIDAPVMKEEEKKKAKTKETSVEKKEEVTQKKEETKEEVMKHPPEQHEEKSAPPEFTPRGKKAGERTHKAGVFSKTQKPKHEKKK